MGEPSRRDPHARSSVQLTHEEIQVLKDCRVNSLYYRGIPLGLLSCFVAKTGMDTGYFPFLKRWSRVVYVGVFGLGLFTGIASYKDTCFRKIMALENSALKEQFLQYQRERGVAEPASEFSPVGDEKQEPVETLNFENEAKDEFQSPLMKRMQERSHWDEIRQQRQRQQNTSEKRSGLNYEDLRNRNRGGIKNQQSIEEERNEDSSSNQINLETYTPLSFSEDKSSKALDFSNDSNDQISLYRSDDAPEYQEKTTLSKRRRNFPQRGRKNEYGDEMD